MRGVLVLVAIAVLVLALPPARAHDDAGYFELVAPEIVERGGSVNVVLINRGLNVSAFRVDLADPRGEPAYNGTVLVADDWYNWTTVRFSIATGPEWAVGLYRLVVESCGACVGMGDLFRLFVADATVRVVRGASDGEAAIFAWVAQGESGEATWPDTIVNLGVASFLGWSFVLVFVVRALTLRRFRGKSTRGEIVRGAVRFNLVHAPGLWLENKRLAKIDREKSDLRARYREIVASEDRLKDRAGIRHILDVDVPADLPAIGGSE